MLDRRSLRSLRSSVLSLDKDWDDGTRSWWGGEKGSSVACCLFLVLGAAACVRTRTKSSVTRLRVGRLKHVRGGETAITRLHSYEHPRGRLFQTPGMASQRSSSHRLLQLSQRKASVSSLLRDTWLGTIANWWHKSHWRRSAHCPGRSVAGSMYGYGTESSGRWTVRRDAGSSSSIIVSSAVLFQCGTCYHSPLTRQRSAGAAVCYGTRLGLFLPPIDMSS
jgi:hypothetical protein